jgi:ketosteroid isomerase-like protein
MMHTFIEPPRATTLAAAFALALLVSAPAVGQTPPPAPSKSSPRPVAAPLPSVTLPPELDRILRDYEKGWRAGDAAVLASLFAEDGFVLQGGREPVRGREAIRAAYTGPAGGPLTLRALAYAVEGSVGYIIGAYTYDPTAGDTGKFTLTLRRASDGRWLIFSDMDNGNRPMRRPPGAQPSTPSTTSSPAR